MDARTTALTFLTCVNLYRRDPAFPPAYVSTLGAAPAVRRHPLQSHSCNEGSDSTVSGFYASAGYGSAHPVWYPAQALTINGSQARANETAVAAYAGHYLASYYFPNE